MRCCATPKHPIQMNERQPFVRWLSANRQSLFRVLKDASENQQPSVRGAAATGFGRLPSGRKSARHTEPFRYPLPPVRIAAAVKLGKFHGLLTLKSP